MDRRLHVATGQSKPGDPVCHRGPMRANESKRGFLCRGQHDHTRGCQHPGNPCGTNLSNRFSRWIAFLFAVYHRREIVAVVKSRSLIRLKFRPFRRGLPRTALAKLTFQHRHRRIPPIHRNHATPGMGTRATEKNSRHGRLRPQPVAPHIRRKTGALKNVTTSKPDLLLNIGRPINLHLNRRIGKVAAKASD